MESSKEKTDEHAFGNLQTNIQMALQQNNIYKQSQKIAENTHDNSIMLIYNMDENGIVTLTECIANDKTMGGTKDTDSNSVGYELAKFKEMFENYINGQIEPISIQSMKYKYKELRFVVTYPDVDFKVNISMSIEDV